MSPAEREAIHDAIDVILARRRPLVAYGPGTHDGRLMRWTVSADGRPLPVTLRAKGGAS